MRNNNLSYAFSDGFVPPGITAADYLARAKAEVPEKKAIVYKDTELSYKQLFHLVDQLSLALIYLGIKKGDRVAIYMPNWPEFILASQAVLNLGAIKVPLSINYRKMELTSFLKHSEAKILIMASHANDVCLTDIVKEVRLELPQLEHIIVKGQTPEGMLNFDELISQDWSEKYGGNYVQEVYKKTYQVEADDIAAIVYTSGTTGKPKGVLQTHNTIYRAALSSNITREVTPNEIWLGMLPLTSAFGVEYVEPCFIISGSTLVLLEGFDALEALNEIQKNKVTSPIGVPTMLIRMLNHPDFKKYDVSSVRNVYLGGAAAPEEMMRTIKQRFNCTITMTYGASELCHATMTHLDDPIQVITETSGLPIYGGVEVKIVGEQGRILPIGEVGLIYVRSFAGMLGYFNDPEKTAETIDEKRWICVGDMGKMDESGRLIVVGRKKDMIVRGGQNIYPDEVESVLSSHPKISEVSIVGYPDPDLGERSCAFIILKTGYENISRSELADFLIDKVAKYKIPDRVEIVEQFPMTHSGKVKKNFLRSSLTGGVEQ